MSRKAAWHAKFMMTSVAFQVLCEAPAMQTPDSATLWGQLLQSLLAQMENRAPATEVCSSCFSQRIFLLLLVHPFSSLLCKLTSLLEEPDKRIKQTGTILKEWKLMVCRDARLPENASLNAQSQLQLAKQSEESPFTFQQALHCSTRPCSSKISFLSSFQELLAYSECNYFTL